MFAAMRHHDRAVRRDDRRHVGKEPAQHGTKRASEERHQPRRLGHAHDAEPERHDPDQADGDLDGGLRRFDGAFETASAVPLNAATTSAMAMRPNQM